MFKTESLVTQKFLKRGHRLSLIVVIMASFLSSRFTSNHKLVRDPLWDEARDLFFGNSSLQLIASIHMLVG